METVSTNRPPSRTRTVALGPEQRADEKERGDDNRHWHLAQTTVYAFLSLFSSCLASRPGEI